jgi:non-heme chloroperoxidase
MPYFDASDGARLFFADWGDGQPVLLSHAWGLNSNMWTYQVPALLQAGFRCVAFDRRGHGRSDLPSRGYDYDQFADDVAALVEHLDLDDIALVGHSAGCGDLIRYLSRAGDERAARLVLISPVTPLLAWAEDNPVGISPEALLASGGQLAADVPRWCEDNAPPFFGQTPVSAGLFNWVMRQIIDVPLNILLETSALMAHTDFRDELRQVGLPTLVVHGALDASAPVQLTGDRTAELLADCRYIVYETSGHGLFAADHQRLNGDLVAFLCGDGREEAATSISGSAA